MKQLPAIVISILTPKQNTSTMVTPSYYQPLINPPKTTQKTTQKCLLFSLSLAALFSFAYLGLLIIEQTTNQSSSPIYNPLCDKSHDPSSCLALISEVVYHEPVTTKSPGSNSLDLLGKILSSHMSNTNKAINEITREINHSKGLNHVQRGTLADCLELMDLSRDRVAQSIKALAKPKSYTNTNDINAWLSAVLTNHVTCLDQLQEYSSQNMLFLRSIIQGLISKGRALLAIHAKVAKNTLEGSRSRTARLYPSWVRRSDRKLLGASGSEIEANVVVAKDGSGDFKTVAEAVAGAPDKGKSRYVIYVKAGVYEENVEVGKKKKNIMIVGDGMNMTIITGCLNVVDGSTTFRSATLAAVGDGFILQDICIQNTAGAEKHQAVALRVGADQSVINRCKIDAYQDTLYAHSLRQFYRACSILGTVDFIFGNAAVVFQKCKLIARKPMDNQKNMVTAQGRIDPNQNTGTSIQYCDIIASSDLCSVQAQVPTFLGRPWKNYSRTVVMQSHLGDHIHPKGWSEWDGDFALDTLYYAEYKNRGPGSDTSKRVNWTGYHVITDAKEAKQFTVGEFIQGQEWLDSGLVPYVEGL